MSQNESASSAVESVLTYVVDVLEHYRHARHFTWDDRLHDSERVERQNYAWLQFRRSTSMTLLCRYVADAERELRQHFSNDPIRCDWPRRMMLALKQAFAVISALFNGQTPAEVEHNHQQLEVLRSEGFHYWNYLYRHGSLTHSSINPALEPVPIGPSAAGATATIGDPTAAARGTNLVVKAHSSEQEVQDNITTPPEPKADYLSATQLANQLDQPADRVETFLRRLAERRPDIRLQVNQPRRNEAQFLYRVTEVWPDLVRQLTKWRNLSDVG
jgi:hypothetical protein